MKKEIVLIKKRNTHCPFCDAKAQVKKSGVVAACKHCKTVVPAGSKFVYTFRKTIKPPRYTRIGRILKRIIDKKMLVEIHKRVDADNTVSQAKEDKALIDSFLQDTATTMRETKKTKRYYGDVSDYLNIRKWKSKIAKLRTMIDIVRQSGEGKLGPYRRQIKEIKRKMHEAKRQKKLED